MSNTEQTLSIIKPDAVERNLDNEIKEMFINKGFKIVKDKKIQIELMGATKPEDAAEGTIRKKYGISIDKNSVHGSDSVENAKIEIDFFFKD